MNISPFLALMLFIVGGACIVGYWFVTATEMPEDYDNEQINDNTPCK